MSGASAVNVPDAGVGSGRVPIHAGIPSPGGEHPVSDEVFRFVHPDAFGEHYTALPQVGVIVPDPDVRQLDPLGAPAVRAATIPLAHTVRPFDKWSNGVLAGEHGEFSPLVQPSPLQDMEAIERIRRNSFRMQPGPWDEDLVDGRVE